MKKETAFLMAFLMMVSASFASVINASEKDNIEIDLKQHISDTINFELYSYVESNNEIDDERYEVMFVGNSMDDIDINNVPDDSAIEYIRETEEIRILAPTSSSALILREARSTEKIISDSEVKFSPAYIPEGLELSTEVSQPPDVAPYIATGKKIVE